MKGDIKTPGTAAVDSPNGAAHDQGSAPTKEILESRRAALNLMEDAVEAREQAERAMAELRRSEKRQAFLLKLADAIRWLSDPEKIKEAAAQLLGVELRANRVCYCEVRNDQWIVGRCYERDVAPLRQGPYAPEKYGRWIMDTYRAGERVVLRDARTDPRFAGDGGREAHVAIDVIAMIGVPLVKDGGLVAVLVVHVAEPRDWDEYEITLLEETAERTWAAVERAGAEFALREKEAELDAIINETPFMLTRCTRDLHYRYVSRAYAAMLNSTPEEINGKAIIDVMGEEGWRTVAPRIERVLRGERVEYEQEVEFRNVGDPYLHVVYTPDIDAAGNVNGWFASIVDVTERRLADEALRASEEQYRSLFTSMDEGFCTIEVLFDDDGTAMDYRFLETNPAFERQTGLRDAAGKKMREIAPNHEEFWFETYGRIAKTGEATRFEHEAVALGRFYDVYAFRIDDPKRDRVAILFNDITDRKRREANLAVLAEISKDLVRLTDVGETWEAVGAKIGEHFKVSRCNFVEIDAANDRVVITRDWHQPGLPDLRDKVYSLAGFFQAEFEEPTRAGEILVVQDTASDPRTGSPTFKSLATRSFVSVPFVKGGDLEFVITFSDVRPREWRPDEVELIGELANRIWIRLEQARADEALRKASLKLRESTQLFFGLIENAPFGVYLVDSDFRLAQVSAAAQKVFENVDPLIGRNFEEVLRTIWEEPFASEAVQRFRHTFETGEEYRSEDTVETRADVAHVESYDWMLKRIRLPDGTLGVVCYFFDLSERRRAEMALLESQERFTAAQRAGNIGVWDWHAPSDQTYWSETMWGIYGLDEPQASAEKLWENALHPEDAADARAKVFAQLTSGEATYRDEFRILRPDGSVRWIESVARIFRDENGRAIRMSGVNLDITDRKRAELELQESEERLRLVTESFQDFAIFTTNLHGEVITWNPGAQNIFRYKPDEILGRHGRVLFVPEDQEKGECEAEMETARLTGRAADERWHLRKDGSRFYASGIMAPIYGGGELIGYAKIARDLTRQKEAEEELRRQHEELESIVAGRTAQLADANNALVRQMEERRLIEEERFTLMQKIVTTQEDERRRIARDMHDSLGQQMTALRLKIASLKDDHSDDPKIVESLGRLQELGAKVDADVNFLVWQLRPTVLDDLGLVSAIENYIREWSRHYGIPSEFHAGRFRGGRLDETVETHLYRISQEALNNIYKHARAQNVTVLLESRRKEIVLVIEDDGIGFDPDNVRPNAASGRGLGLVGMRERAAIIGGKVELESSPGNGTTVFVSAPHSQNGNELK